MNKFALVNVVMRRARQLNNGAEPVIDDPDPGKAMTTALREIKSGRVTARFYGMPEADVRKERRDCGK